MKIYVSDFDKSYKDTIIGHLGNSGTVDLLLHILQFWSACALDKYEQILMSVRVARIWS